MPKLSAAEGNAWKKWDYEVELSISLCQCAFWRETVSEKYGACEKATWIRNRL